MNKPSFLERGKRKFTRNLYSYYLSAQSRNTSQDWRSNIFRIKGLTVGKVLFIFESSSNTALTLGSQATFNLKPDCSDQW